MSNLFSLMAATVLATACATQVAISDEQPSANDPDAPIQCPPGSIKRIAADTLREVDPVRLADATSLVPAGYVYPRMLAPPRVRYPGNILSRKPGFVSVLIVVGRDGAVSEPRVVCSSDTGFEQAALDSVPTMRIEPANLKGVPQEELVIIPIQFNIR